MSVMLLKDFFKARQTVVWSPEYLKNLMTSLITGLEDDYHLGEALITESKAGFQNEIFPVVVIELTPHSGDSYRDYLIYIPETDDVRLWCGALEYRVVSPNEIGRRFSLRLSDAIIEGKLIMGQGNLCFQFKSHYHHEELE